MFQILTMKKLLTSTFTIIFLVACESSSPQNNAATQNNSEPKDIVTVPSSSNTLDSIADLEKVAKINLPKKNSSQFK